jgi:DNA-binding MarR family transcriptional regulator
MSDPKLVLEEFLPYRLNRLADAVSREFSQIYRDRFGITRPEWRTLATLGEFGTMTATQVSAHSAMHKTKVSRAVAELETRRWLTRTADDKDRRIEMLELTNAGLAAYREMVPLAAGFQDSLLTKLEGKSRETLLRAIDTLERSLNGRLDV